MGLRASGVPLRLVAKRLGRPKPQSLERRGAESETDQSQRKRKSKRASVGGLFYFECHLLAHRVTSVRCGILLLLGIAEVEFPVRENTPALGVPLVDHLRHLAFRRIECAGFWRP